MSEINEVTENNSAENREVTENKPVETEQINQLPTKPKRTRPPRIIEDKVWQEKLLPFMMATLIGLTIFFIAASYFEFRDFKRRLDKQSEQSELKTILDNAGNKSFTEADKDQFVEYTKWRTMVWLENESINRRYTHSNTLILSRMWTRYIGFLVGMIMAIVGAVFILGKLRESETQLSSEANLFKISVTSASPGIILATLGTILLLTTVIVTTEVKVSDGSLYLPKTSSDKSANSFAPPADIIFDDDPPENSNKTNQTNNTNSDKTDKEE